MRLPLLVLIFVSFALSRFSLACLFRARASLALLLSRARVSLAYANHSCSGRRVGVLCVAGAIGHEDSPLVPQLRSVLNMNKTEEDSAQLDEEGSTCRVLRVRVHGC